jgi:hypothetical protein
MKDQWIEWLQEKQRNFFYGIALVVVVFFATFQIVQKFHKPAPSNYLSANLAFERWIVHDKDFENLEKALTAHPDLNAKFGALIADKFIARNQGDKAKTFADAVFERVVKQIPEHTAFAENSLLISQGKLTEALTQSLTLKERLDKSSLLYGFNLLRLASLYRALDDHTQELASLEHLEQYLNSNPKANSILQQCFSEGKLTLNSYISQRKSDG